MASPYISYNASTKTYSIRPGASVTDIAGAASSAAVGATLYFESGTHKLTDTLIIKRGDITLSGAGRDKTIIVVAHDDAEGIRFDGGKPVWEKNLVRDVTQGSKSFLLHSGHDVKAGDVLGLHMDNDASLRKYGPYEIVEDSPYYKDKPLRESLVQVERVEGNIAYLKHEIGFNMTAAGTTVAKYDLFENVAIKDLTVTYNLGDAKDPTLFENPKTDYKQAAAFLITGTLGLEVNNVAIRDAASTAMIIRRALEPSVDNYLAEGAHNKGSDKNGYGLTIEEVFYGKFTNLDLIDMRHAFLFGGWNAETNNDVHVRTMNRDINYHGGPDHSNTVLVDYGAYLDGKAGDGDRKAWSIVDDGGEINPPTDISKNTNLFKTALGSYRDEEIHGWDGGAWLDGRGGNDLLLGGRGNDVLTGGIGDDVAVGGAGRDAFVIRPGDGQFAIADFAGGANGDTVVLNGFNVSSFSALPWKQSGKDVVLTLENTTITLKNITLSALKPENVAFNVTITFKLPYQ